MNSWLYNVLRIVNPQKLTGLENRRGGNSTVGSNPTPSAKINDL